MKVAFANSATMPTIERLILRKGSRQKVSLRVRYGIVIHPKLGPTLIDTGYTPETTQGPRSWPLRLYGMVFRPRLLPDGQIDVTLQKFGLIADDIKHVIITHFHADHISGLRRFPNARFYVDQDAAQSVLAGPGFANIRHGFFKELLPDDFAERLIDLKAQPRFENGNALPDGFDLAGDHSIIAIPLPGHTHSHFGIYFPTLERPFLYATDVQWLTAAIIENRLPGFPSSIATADTTKAAAAADIVRQYAHAGGEVVLCHDPKQTAWDI
ncbi:MAG: MBL fold metallo-hydrolase [Yoonia sp.]|uniref:MBL fold metallo-hydrolase n=1 Tax=Yoonia sp. TaxID=2212373 RepID=UPI0032639E76